jgi:hypothetical protein
MVWIKHDFPLQCSRTEEAFRCGRAPGWLNVSLVCLQELYNMRSEYGQKKHALEFCNSTFTTIGERKFCILHLLEGVKVRSHSLIAPTMHQMLRKLAAIHTRAHFSLNSDWG